MAASALDAMFGRIRSNGVEIELEGALNFKGILTATRNQADGCIDIESAADISAEGIAYDNDTSGLTATNMQDAIDELDSVIDNLVLGVLPVGSVSNAELADMTAATVKGRAVSAGTGAPQDLTAVQVLTIVNVALETDALLQGAIPSGTGDHRVSYGHETKSRNEDNDGDIGVWSFGVIGSNILGVGGNTVAQVYTEVETGGAATWYIGGDQEMAIDAAALTLPTNNIVLTDGSVLYGATPATTGRSRYTNTDGLYWRNIGNSDDLHGVSVDASDRLLLGANAGVVEIRSRALTTHRWYLAGVEEMTLSNSTLALATNSLTLTAGSLLFGAAPATTGLTRFGHDTVVAAGLNSAGNDNVLILRWGQEGTNVLSVGSGAAAIYSNVTSDYRWHVNGVEEARLDSSALTLATNNLTLTAGNLAVTAGVITQGASPASGGSFRVGNSWSLTGVATDTSNVTLISLGSNQLYFGASNDLVEMGFDIASGTFRFFVATTEKFRVDANAVYVYTRLEVGAAPAGAGSLRFSNENSIQWAGSSGGDYVGLWLDSNETLRHGGSNVIGHTFDSDSTGVYAYQWEGTAGLTLSADGTSDTIITGLADNLLIQGKDTGATGGHVLIRAGNSTADGVLTLASAGETSVFSIQADASVRFWGALTSGASPVSARPTFANGGTATTLAQLLERYGILEVTGE